MTSLLSRSWPRPRSARSCSKRSPPAREDPEVHRSSLDWLEQVPATRGCRFSARPRTLRSGFAFTLENWNLYDASPAWRDITTGTKEEKIAKMKDPEHARGGQSDEQMAMLDKIAAGIRRASADRSSSSCSGSRTSPSLRSTSARPSGRSRRKKASIQIDVMLDLSLAADLKAEFLGDPQFNAEFIRRDHQRIGVHVPGRIGRRRAHQVLHRRRVHYRLPALAGARRKSRLARGGALSPVGAARACGRLQGPRHPARGRGGRRGRVRPQAPRRSSRTGSAKSTHDLPGGEWRRVQRAKGYHSIIGNGVETCDDGNAPARRRASCFATGSSRFEVVTTKAGAHRRAPAFFIFSVTSRAASMYDRSTQHRGAGVEHPPHHAPHRSPFSRYVREGVRRDGRSSFRDHRAGRMRAAHASRAAVE